MASLKFVDQHNMVACLEKSEENTEFHQIVDFLSTCSINYALTVSPTIYASYIEQFWNTATSKTVNSVKQIHAIVNDRAIVISESSVRNDLLFYDEDDSRDSLEDTNGSEGTRVQSSHDSPLSGDHTSEKAEGGLNLEKILWKLPRMLRLQRSLI
ncbi:hypothetical protein Tco_0571513 [Tanacetum coccineum]